MSWTYSYPRFGMQRGGTLTYVNGGGSYGRFSGWGQEGGGQSTTPSSAAGTPPLDVINALYAQAGAQGALGAASLVTGNAVAGSAQMATSAALYKQAEDIKAGRAMPPGIARSPGRGRGLEKVREWWAQRSQAEKVVIGGGAGVGALALLRFAL